MTSVRDFIQRLSSNQPAAGPFCVSDKGTIKKSLQVGTLYVTARKITCKSNIALFCTLDKCRKKEKKWNYWLKYSLPFLPVWVQD